MDNVIGHTQLQSQYKRIISKGLVPYVRSAPGIGKSDSAKKFAAEYDLKVIDIRLSQCMPEDLQGYPMRDGNKATFTPFDIFPLEGEPLPAKLDEDGKPLEDKDGKIIRYNGWLLLLDELSSANKAVQAAAYKIILDKQVGSFKLHPKCAMIACGNRLEDKAVVHKMSTALQSRLVHLTLDITVKEWTDWAYDNGIDGRIIGYINFEQKNLMNFKPDHNDYTYACPRTWEFLNRMIHDQEVDRIKDLPLVAGTVGSGAGIAFLSFCEVAEDLPDWNDLINPAINSKLQISNELSARFATICWMATKAKEDEVVLMLPFVKRFAPDLQVIFCRGVLRRFPQLDRKEKEFGTYAVKMIVDLRE